MSRRWIMPLAIPAAFVLIACGGAAEAPDGDGPSPTAGSPTGSPTESPGDEVRIAMEDNSFVPNSLEIAAGAELELDNEGQNPHTFTVEESIDVEVAAGEDDRVTVDLDPGTYQFICRFHESLGMRGSLTVV